MTTRLDEYLAATVEPALTLLPLHAEPVGNWSPNSDLAEFITLVSGSRFSYAREGTAFWLQYPVGLFNEARDRASESAIALGVKAKRAGAYFGFPQFQAVPDFAQDPSFGLFAKHWMSWEAFQQAMLEESMFFSLAHLLEAGSELEAAVLLARDHMYRPSYQLLRNFLEDMVLPLFFAASESAYGHWLTGDFRTPPLRGRGGMLRILRDNAILDERLEQQAAIAYGRLSASVHGAESALTYRGIHKGRSAGHFFTRVAFEQWCKEFAAIVGLGMHLYLRNLKQVARIREANPLECETCHSTKPDTGPCQVCTVASPP